MFEDQAAETALRAFCAYLDAHPEIGLVWAMDKGDTLACELKARFAPTARGRKAKPLRTFTVWADAQPDQENLLPLWEDGREGEIYSYIFRWADNINLSFIFVYLQWRWFEREFTTGNGALKKQRDWVQHFYTSLRNGWGKNWWLDGNEFKLTSAGRILEREFPPPKVIIKLEEERKARRNQ
jgi:hypothetical protein